MSNALSHKQLWSPAPPQEDVGLFLRAHQPSHEVINLADVAERMVLAQLRPCTTTS